MPRYDYRCTEGHIVEHIHSIKDSPEITCAECGAVCERVIGHVATVYKGSGWIDRDLKRIKENTKRNMKKHYDFNGNKPGQPQNTKP